MRRLASSTTAEKIRELSRPPGNLETIFNGASSVVIPACDTIACQSAVDDARSPSHGKNSSISIVPCPMSFSDLQAKPVDGRGAASTWRRH